MVNHIAELAVIRVGLVSNGKSPWLASIHKYSMPVVFNSGFRDTDDLR